MGNRLLVGNLSLETSESDLEELFSEAGIVQSVSLVTDKQTGRAKGFACVSMTTAQEAQKAIQLLDGESIEGRSIIVNAYISKASAPPSLIAKFLEFLGA
jgi:RNA recognition motif-containing protein